MVKLIKKHHRKIILTVPILFLMVSGEALIQGNSIFLKPSTIFPEVNSPFNIEVNYRSNSAFNATDGIITFSNDNLIIEKVDTSKTSIDLWGATPEWSNANGVITWSGGIISPKLKNGKQEGNILKILLKANRATTSIITIKEGTLLAANGTADNILESVGNIKIYPRPKNTPTPDIDLDGKLTTRDITQVIMGISRNYNPHLDLNIDKLINYKDVNLIINYYNEINK